MINGREYRVTILLLYREIIADSILGSNSAATFYNTTLKEQSFSEGGFTWAIIAKKCNVFDFVSLIYFHGILD